MDDEDARKERFHKATRAFLDDLSAYMKRSEDDEGETIRIVLDVPAEWLMLAEWMALRREARDDDRWAPYYTLEDRPVRPARWNAKKELWLTLYDWFHMTVHHLYTGIHPMLYGLSDDERASIERRKKSKREKKPPESDDGIPF